MILDSFRADRARRTQAEIKRRFEICVDLFKILRGDCRYSMERTLDAIPAGLRARLDGQPWEPSTRPWWFGVAKEDLEAAGVEYSAISTDEAPLLWTPQRARYGVS